MLLTQLRSPEPTWPTHGLTASDLTWLAQQLERAGIPLPRELDPVDDNGWLPGWNCEPEHLSTSTRKALLP